MDSRFKIKEILKKTFLRKVLASYRKSKSKRKAESKKRDSIKQWRKNGSPIPPPHVYKASVIREYAAIFRIRTFIETGTYLGETIEACKAFFRKLISIELDQALYENAIRTFSNDKHVSIYHGDSGRVIERILTELNEPCLFWLDGHYSEGFTAKGDLNTPILNELKHIFDHHIKDHVILIDDARCFTGENDYPTLEYLRSITKKHDPALQFTVSDDIIRIHK